LFGYHAPYSEYIPVDNVPAGDYGINFSVVPAGEVWVITAVFGYCLQALVDGVLFRPTVDGTSVILASRRPTVPGLGLEWTGWITLRQGDFATLWFLGCALNDDVRGFVTGYKMLITA